MSATAAALVGAAEVGLLDAILEQPTARRSAADLARALGLHADATERVLTMLAAIEVVVPDERGRFGPGALLWAEAEGPSGSPGNSARMWAQIIDYLRSGRCVLDRVEAEQPRGPAYASAVAGLGRLFRSLSEELAAALGPVPGAGRVLDVGAGSGQWSLAMAAGQGHAHVTALDLEPVLPRFRERATALDLADRVTTIAGDYHRVELEPESYDRIVAANVLHLETEADAAALVRRLASALAPAGQLVIIDALPTGLDDLRQPPLAAYNLSLGLRVGRGRPHPEPTLRSWLIAAGLPECRVVTAGSEPGFIGALVGQRGEPG